MKQPSNDSTVTKALSLSLMPAFFAAGCCATAPLMIIFGFSFSETALVEYRWLIRGLGLVILGTSLWIYFNRQGIKTIHDYISNKKMVWAISVQTFVYSLLMYLFLVTQVTPFLWQAVLERSVACCSLY